MRCGSYFPRYTTAHKQRCGDCGVSGSKRVRAQILASIAVYWGAALTIGIGGLPLRHELFTTLWHAQGALDAMPPRRSRRAAA